MATIMVSPELREFVSRTRAFVNAPPAIPATAAERQDVEVRELLRLVGSGEWGLHDHVMRMCTRGWVFKHTYSGAMVYAPDHWCYILTGLSFANLFDLEWEWLERRQQAISGRRVIRRR